jgi:hypothetical protein
LVAGGQFCPYPVRARLARRVGRGRADPPLGPLRGSLVAARSAGEHRGLHVRSHGGTGDVARTLAVCRLLAEDPDDMVVKALSWALRELVVHDPEAVRAFLDEHDDVLAARVKREVRNKLRTGLKNPRD